MHEAICERLPGGGRVTEIVALADAFLTSPHVVVLDPPGPTPDHPGTSPLSRASGRWTTPEMLATERHLLDLVAASRHFGAHSGDFERPFGVSIPLSGGHLD